MMRAWFNGRTLASQASNGGSIPLARSKLIPPHQIMMYSKIISCLTLVCLSPVLLLAETVQFTDCGLSEPAAEGIYELGIVMIKYLPPPGWKKNNYTMTESRVAIEFMPSCSEFDILEISIVRPPFPISTEELKEAADKDVSVIDSEIISFADTAAVKTIALASNTKTEQIMFYQNNMLFAITFDGESTVSFDKRIAEVNASLKSFEIVTPPSKLKEYFNTQGSASQQLLLKFNTVSDKVCLEALVQINQQAKKYANEELTYDQLTIMAKEASSELMRRFNYIFIDPEPQALRMLSEGFDDKKNRQEMESCFDDLSKLGVEVPEPIFYLLSRYNQNQLKGIELEFTARLVKEYLRQIKP